MKSYPGREAAGRPSTLWSLNLALVLGAVPNAGEDGFRASLDHQARLAVVDASLDATESGATHALSLRTLLAARLGFDRWALAAELQDARAYALGPATRTGTDIVNALEPIQAYGELRLGSEDESVRIRLGRMTMNLGSRRLVGRQAYRNTVNAFTGARVDWTRPGLGTLTNFLVLPQARRPKDPNDLFDNDIQLDAERPRQILAGTFYAPGGPLEAAWSPELYVFVLWESQRPTSRARRLVTPGGRFTTDWMELEFQLEAALQIGQSRLSLGGDELDHLAGMIHGRVRKRFEAVDFDLTLDFASGDGDPLDGGSHRFDSLFGVQIMDFGFTGLWSNFARSNILSPSLAARMRPVPGVKSFVRYRPVWLAAAADLWAGTPFRDPTGQSGRFLGHQVEASIRVQLAEAVGCRIGGAVLALGEAGRRLRDASEVSSRGPPLLGFTQFDIAI